MPGKMKFTSLSDRFKAAVMAAAVYAPFCLANHLIYSDPKLAYELARIAATYVALRIPYIRQVPMAVTRFLFMPLIARDKKPAPELQAQVEALLEKAGSGKKVRVYTFSKGILKNAFAFGGDIYVGETIAQTFGKEEKDFILAHELSHICAEDMSERFLFWPPLAMALAGVLATGLATGWNTVDALLGNAESQASLPETYKYFGLALGAFAHVSGVYNLHSRFLEFRADRNGLQLCGSLDAAKAAMARIGINEDYKPSWFETIRAGHPIGADRIGGLVKADEDIRRFSVKNPGPSPVPAV